MFTEEEMEIANRIFSVVIFKKAHFEELTRDHLFLPTGQNEILFGNLTLEGNLKFGKDRRFRHIFTFK